MAKTYFYKTDKPVSHILMKWFDNLHVFKDAPNAKEWIEKWAKKDPEVMDYPSALIAYSKKYDCPVKQKQLSEFFDEFFKVFPEARDAVAVTIEVDSDTWDAIKGFWNMNRFIEKKFSLSKKV